MKINIIGSGWLAQPLGQYLQRQGHQLVLTSTDNNKAEQLSRQGIPTMVYQLGDTIESANELLECDALIVAITHKEVNDFKKFLSQLNDQQRVHLIYISSTSVYANDGQCHDENSSALNQPSPLLAIEHLLRTYPQTTIIRLAGLAGPGRHPGRFFVRSGKISNPNAAVNLIHLDDCIGIIEQVIEQHAWNETFNGCADNHPEKGVYYQHMAKLSGHPVPQLAENKQGSNKIIDNKKVKQQLAYSFKYPDVFDFTFD
jgi:nucleoside-diphosphate-sugar epimerase